MNNMDDYNDEQTEEYAPIALIKNQLVQRSYFKNLFLIIISALAMASVYMFEYHQEYISIGKALLALGIIWISLFPSLHYLLERNQAPIPFFPLVGLFYATGFGLPMFASNIKLTGRLSWTTVTEQSLTLVLLGILGMNIAFYTSKSSLWKKVSPIQLPNFYSQNRLYYLTWVMLLAHIAFLYIPSIQKIPSLGQLLEPIGYIAYGTFYIMWSRGKLPIYQALTLLLVFVPLEIIKRFSSGLLAELMILGLYIILIIWYERKRIPVIFITITMLMYLAFNPVKSEYRQLTWNDRSAPMNPIDKVSLFINLAVKHYQGANTSVKTSENSTANPAIERSAQILLFSDVMEKTPKLVPYWNGETYLPLFTSFIPRALWSDKPIEMVGNQFGHRYHYLDYNDKITSINLPWIVEMYANFGILGVLIGMPLVGVFLAFLEQKLNSSKMEPLEVVMGAAVLFRLIYQESNFSVMVGSVVSLIVILYLVFKFALGNQK